ncbi:MAG: acyl-CoA thioester hydrolase/BAAT C-terminal domain-containing protein [Gemmatimonadales bacterium]
MTSAAPASRAARTVDDNYDSLAADAAAGVAFLRSRAEVDRKRVGVWGVSQGGQLAPIVARRAGGVAFLVNLSGSTVNSNDQEIQRTGLKLRADGFPAGDVRASMALQRLKFAYACRRTEEAWRSYAAALEQARGAAWLPDPPGNRSARQRC